MKLQVISNTHLKSMPVALEDLGEIAISNSLIPVASGELEIVSHSFYEGAPGADDDNYYVRLVEPPAEGVSELNWFISAEHVQIDGTEPTNDPKDEPATNIKAVPKDYGPTINIPGISRPVGIYEPIYFEPKPSNFTWAEFTKEGKRIPVDATITMRIVKLAKYMDGVRSLFGDRPIGITSGYRDPDSNRFVGGARDSRHMYGDAVDFWVQGLDVVVVFMKLKTYHQHGGLAVGNGFVHLDLRPGAAARWTYPGGPRVSLW